MNGVKHTYLLEHVGKVDYTREHSQVCIGDWLAMVKGLGLEETTNGLPNLWVRRVRAHIKEESKLVKEYCKHRNKTCFMRTLALYD